MSRVRLLFLVLTFAASTAVAQPPSEVPLPPLALPAVTLPPPAPSKPADPPKQPPVPTLDPSKFAVGKPVGPASAAKSEPQSIDSTLQSKQESQSIELRQGKTYPAPVEFIRGATATGMLYGDPPKSSLPLGLVWNNGLFVETPKKEFVLHLGGVIQYDGAWYTGGQSVQTFPGGVGRFSDGVTPRRLRLLAEGSFYSNVDFKLDVEFANAIGPTGSNAVATAATTSSSPIPLDAWVTLKEVPVLGNVRVGNQKEWFSLEHLESARALEFLERSYLFDFSQPSAFNNGRSPGVSAFRTWADDRVFTAVGAYKNESDLLGFGLNDGQYAVTGRVAALPIWCPDQKWYWHVGGAMSHRDPVDDAVRVRVRSAVRNAPNPLLNLVADTGTVNATAQDLFNLETAAAYGPVSASGEYTANLIRGARVAVGPDLGTLVYQGFYAQGMVFLTGEHRAWDPKAAVFKRVIPLRNLSFKDGTIGAVELVGRYSHLNLDDKGVNGGRLNGVTLGTTWYWNPNVRVQVNYDYLYRDGGANPLAKGSIHSLGTRLAMDF